MFLKVLKSRQVWRLFYVFQKGVGMLQRFFTYAAFNGFLVVVFGAFGAHSLEAIISESSLATWQTAVLYQMFHVLALIIAGLACYLFPTERSFIRAGYAFQIGVVLFSGSLYLLALTGITFFAYPTPFGGVAFLLGWAFLIFGLLKNRTKSL